jgi:hypothetical protein
MTKPLNVSKHALAQHNNDRRRRPQGVPMKVFDVHERCRRVAAMTPARPGAFIVLLAPRPPGYSQPMTEALPAIASNPVMPVASGEIRQ